MLPVDPATALPVAAAVDDADDADDADGVIDVLDLPALSALVAGSQPYARTRHLSNLRREASLLPEGATVLREAFDDDDVCTLAAGDGWTRRANRWGNPANQGPIRH